MESEDISDMVQKVVKQELIAFQSTFVDMMSEQLEAHRKEMEELRKEMEELRNEMEEQRK